MLQLQFIPEKEKQIKGQRKKLHQYRLLTLLFYTLALEESRVM